MEELKVTPPRVQNPVNLQNWCNISFLHWEYPADRLQRMLPPGLTLDLHDGTAWIGMTPFVVRGLRPPFLPPLPWISRFPETNVRTYVIGPDGSRGIWFFTLEASRALAVLGARALYGLPYRWARMQVQEESGRILYRSLRGNGAETALTDLVVEPGPEITPGPLEVFLTARFRLFSLVGERLWAADVEHEPWPLRSARIGKLEQTLLSSLSLSVSRGEPLVHHSRGVHTRVGKLVAL